MYSFEAPIAYGGLIAGREEATYIRHFAQRFSNLSRKELTATLCEHLDWLTAAGQPRLEAAAKILARLEAVGVVKLPAVQQKYSSSGKRKRTPLRYSEHTAPGELLSCRLAQLPQVRLCWAATAQDELLCNEYLTRHHPLSYHQPFGYWGRYLIVAGDYRLGCILLSGSARALVERDRWIGWDNNHRRRNLAWVVNNSRFLIFPWVKVPHLASHVLGQLARCLADDWENHWGFRPVLLETFVDSTVYRGSCYRAAGWTCLGRTSGRGLARPGKVYRSTPKLIFTKPLQADFRRLLCSQPPKGTADE